MDSPGLAPGSPACDASVFLLDDEPVSSPKVHASDLSARHAPKDLNPDQLGWNQSCYRYTRDTHLSTAEVTNPACSRSVPDSNSQVAFATTCFQDRLLIRPDDFRLQAAGVGIEPGTDRAWMPGLVPPGSEPGVTTNSNYPASFGKPRHRAIVKVRTSKHSVRESHPICELQRLTPRLRAGESALRESNPPRQPTNLRSVPEAGAFADRPRAHVVQRKGRESNPQGFSLCVGTTYNRCHHP